MKKLAIAAAVLAFAGPAFAADAAALFASKCAACHGKDGKGSAVGKKMGAEDLTKVKESEAKIVATITNGEGKMPGFKGKLSPEEIDALGKYVKGGLK